MPSPHGTITDPTAAAIAALTDQWGQTPFTVGEMHLIASGTDYIRSCRDHLLDRSEMSTADIRAVDWDQVQAHFTEARDERSPR
jgi:hypothetical protein